MLSTNDICRQTILGGISLQHAAIMDAVGPKLSTDSLPHSHISPGRFQDISDPHVLWDCHGARSQPPCMRLTTNHASCKPCLLARIHPGHEESVEAVGFSPHVQQLAASAGVDGKLIIWDLNTLTERGVCQHPDVSMMVPVQSAGNALLEFKL